MTVRHFQGRGRGGGLVHHPSKPTRRDPRHRYHLSSFPLSFGTSTLFSNHPDPTNQLTNPTQPNPTQTLSEKEKHDNNSGQFFKLLPFSTRTSVRVSTSSSRRFSKDIHTHVGFSNALTSDVCCVFLFNARGLPACLPYTLPCPALPACLLACQPP